MSVNKTTFFPFLLTVAIGLSILIILIVIRVYFVVTIQDADKDIRNWVSLVIEAGIGIFISVMVLHYDKSQQRKSKAQQDKISELLGKIDNIITTQNQDIKKRHDFAIGQIRQNLSFCKDMMPTRESLLNYNPEKEVVKDDEPVPITPYDELYYSNESLRDVSEIVNLYSDVLDPVDATQIRKIADYTRYFSKPYDHVDVKLLNLVDGLHKRLDIFFEKFPRV